jgi:hypothetical protein
MSSPYLLRNRSIRKSMEHNRVEKQLKCCCGIKKN